MNNNLPQIFNYEGNQVRTVILENGEPGFVAKDVCDVLELSNSRMTLDRLDEDEKGVSSIDTLGGKQQVQVVTESGLYSLILGSRKPEAKAFKRWVVKEVLPSIRKHGMYLTPQVAKEVLENKVLFLSRAVLVAVEEIKRLEASIETQAEKIALLAPKAEFYNRYMESDTCQTIEEVAKTLNRPGFGRNKLFALARNKGFFNKNNLPRQQYQNQGYFKVLQKISNYTPYSQTVVTPKGFSLFEKVIDNEEPSKNRIG